MIRTNKKIMPIFICVVTLLFFIFLLQPPLNVTGDDVTEKIEIGNHDIFIQQDEKLEIDEKVFFNYTVFHHTNGGTSTGGQKSFNGTLYLWVPEERENLLIESQNIILTYRDENATVVSLNLGENQLEIQSNKQLQLNISYSLCSSFFKKITYMTRHLKVEIAGDKYPQGNIPLEYNPTSDTYAALLHQKDANFTFEINFIESQCSQFNFYSFLLMAIILFLLCVLVYVLFPRKDKMAREPDESLLLRKKLAMDSLKTLEKEREKGNVPDTYYLSIKDVFKREAIRVIQELEKRGKK